MKPTIAIVAPGSMGAAVARRLVDNGLRVLTSLKGLSAASAARAAAAGMTAVPPKGLMGAQLLLSIVPPATALPFAQMVAELLPAAQHKPLFVDCNAVSPQTVQRIAEAITSAGARFVDAGIIGAPPGPAIKGPVFYTSGEHAGEVQALSAYGLDVRVLDGPIGAASALKMCYAGITKGITAVATCMILAAQRAGAADALRAELADSQPALLASLARNVPAMYSKAYRWVAEMQEIATFAGEDPAAAAAFTAAARLYERIANDLTGSRVETNALTEFLAGSSGGSAARA